MGITSLYLTLVMYDIFEDEIFIANVPVNSLELTFYNDQYNGCNDLKKLSFKGKVVNNSEGSIILGSL